MTADPTVDTDNNAEATFIGGVSESAPTFVGPADGSQTIITPTSATQWKRKKNPAVPTWAWGVGGTLAAALIAFALFTSPASNEQATEDSLATNGNSSAAPILENEAGQAHPVDQQTVAGLRFDGNQSKVLPPNYTFDTTQPFTVEVITTPLSFPANDFGVSETAFIFGNSACALRLQPNAEWVFSIKDDKESPNYHARSESSAELGRQVHLAGVSNGEELTLFVDGKQQGVPTPMREPPDFDPWFLFGGVPFAGESGPILRAFDGIVHEARISTRVVYDKDFNPQMTLTTGDKTVAHYRFDAGWGDAVRDLSGNGYDAEIFDADWIAANDSAPQPRSPDSVLPWLDLTNKIDLATDTLEGAWRRNGDGILADDLLARLRLPVRTTGGFECRLTVTAQNKSPDLLGIAIPVGKKRAALTIESATASGLSQAGWNVSPGSAGKNQVGIPLSDSRFKPNTEQTILVRCRRNRDQISLYSELNGEWYHAYDGSVSGLDSESPLFGGRPDEIVITARKTSLVINKVEWRQMYGDAEWLSTEQKNHRYASSRGLSFDHQDARVEVAGFPRNAGKPSTLEAWVTPSGDQGTIIDWYGDTRSFLNRGSSRFYFSQRRLQANELHKVFFPETSTGRPIHIASVWDGTTVHLYLDGKSCGKSEVNHYRLEGGSFSWWG